jgi:hypothetical protein
MLYWIPAFAGMTVTKEFISKASLLKNLPLPLFAILRQAQDDKCHGELVELSLPLVKGG